MEHKQVQSLYGTTHYWIQRHPDKKAKCILFTHGLAIDHSMFEKQVEFFCAEYTVITWDVPLHGLSRPYSDFSYHNAADEMNRILQTESIEKAVLVGMSMGGYPSQEFAYRYPEKVEGFVALDTTPFGHQYYSKLDIWLLKSTAPMAKLFPDRILRKSMAKSASQTQYSYDVMMKMFEISTKRQIIDMMKIAYGSFIKENKDVDFSFPILILLGEGDKTGKVKQYSKAWAKKTGYPFHIIKNAKHFSNGDNPEQVNAEIRDYIRGLG